VNTDTIGGWTAAGGLVNPVQFDAWIQNFVVPYAEHLKSRGMYLVLSATGPINTPNNGSRNAGVVEQQRLITFWQTVANAPGVKSADNIHFELMNEPVEIETVPGNGQWGFGSAPYFQAFRNWIQPVIDVIRATGADNVIWVPTLEWQGSPHQHALYPFTGSNCGVAVHYYPAYGGVFNNATAVQNLWNSQYKPAADLWPMIITEMFWTPFPNDPWNLVNGTTAGFGNAIRNAIDNQGNVSYLVGFLGDLLDDLNDALPANCALSTREGAQAFFDWLPSYIGAAPGGGPSDLKATATSASGVLLTWSPLLGANSYAVKRAPSSGGPYTTIATGITTTNYTDTLPEPIKYYYVVSAVLAEGETPNSMEATVNPPHPWLSQDIGAVGAAGSVSFNNGVFSVRGSGNDIWDNADQFRFVYLPVTGDFTITARVLSVQNTDPWAKGGVMIRASLSTNSAHALVAVTPANGVAMQYRSTTAGGSANNNTTGLNAPYWVRLVRSGNTFTGYRSANGVTWTLITSTSISMNAEVYAGLAVTSHNNPVLCTATFDNVTVPGWENLLPPPPPSDLTATATNGQVQLTWTAAANAVSYNVKRATTDGGPYAFIGHVNTPNYTDTALSNAVPYFYVVTALNLAGESANSVQAAAPAQFLAPVGLAATFASSTNVNLTWSPFPDATSYNVKRSATSGGPYTTIVTGVAAPQFTDIIPAGMKFYYVVSAIANDAESQDSAEATTGLLYPWVTQDVGMVGLTGAASISNGVFTVTGSGNDIWDAADMFRFIYVPVTGNCTITARVVSLQNTDPWAKAGVMIRASLNTNSANAFIAVTPGNGVTFQTRSTTGGSSGFNNTTGLSAPYWVRLVRSGNTFTAFRSVNGVTWTQQGSATAITMAATVYVGLAVTAHNNGTLATATFDNVTLPGWSNWTVPPVPTGLSGLADNGQATLNWTASVNASSYNVKRATTGGGPYTIVANVNAPDYTDPGLTNGITYHYVVSALNPAGESGNSAPTALLPRPPIQLAFTETNLTISWPLASEGFSLQSRTNLFLGDWENVTAPAPQIVGPAWQVELPVSAGPATIFYRLMK
jgi:regulation of enolase protein 1 (concanavalin A-like superfamily)